METTVLGYPRIGPRRELKKATEAYWAGRGTAAGLEETAAALRRQSWETLRDAGLSGIPSNTFSLYDHVLDTAVLVNAVPERFTGLQGLDAYFAMARGTDGIAPLELTKWFDTNYHYLVPEIGPETTFRYSSDRPVREFAEGLADGVLTRPVLVGPVTYLALAKPTEGAPEGFEPLDRLADLLPVYVELLRDLAAAGATWVQLDEPALVSDSLTVTPERVRAAVTEAYRVLATVLARPDRPAILVAAPD